MGRELVTSNARTSREDTLSEVWFGGLACAVRGSSVGGPMQNFSRGTSSSDSSRSPPACRERAGPVSVSSCALSPGRRSSRICVNARGFPPGPVCLLPACTTASEWGRAVLGGAGPLQTQTTALWQTGVPHPHSGHPAAPGQGPRSQLACLPSLQPWRTCFPQPQTVHSFTLEMVPRVYCVQATVLCVFN